MDRNLGNEIVGEDNIGTLWTKAPGFPLPQLKGDVRWEKTGADYRSGYFEYRLVKGMRAEYSPKDYMSNEPPKWLRGISRDKVIFDEEPNLEKGNYADWFEKEYEAVKDWSKVPQEPIREYPPYANTPEHKLLNDLILELNRRRREEITELERKIKRSAIPVYIVLGLLTFDLVRGFFGW